MRKALVISAALLLCTLLSGQNYPELKTLSDKKLEQIAQGSGVSPFQKKNLWGYQDASGKVMVRPVFDSAFPFDEFGCSKVEYRGKWGLVNGVCEYIVVPSYDSISSFNERGAAVVSLDGRQGVINSEGLVLLKVDYDEVRDFAGTNSIVSKDGKSGMVDSRYNFVIPVEYDSISVYDADRYYVVKDGLAGILGLDGRVLVPALYDSVKASSNGRFYVVVKDGRFGTVDKAGNVLVSPRYGNIDDDETGKVFLTGSEGRTGFLGIDGNEVLPAVYDSVRLAGNSNFISFRDGKYGLHAISGQTVTANEFDAIGDIFNGRFFPVRKNGRSGIITLGGASYIPCRYDTVEWNSRGYWVVTDNGLYGAVSDRGDHEELLECGLPYAPELTGTEKLFCVNGHYRFVSINNSISLRDADTQLYDNNRDEINRYINSDAIPSPAKFYVEDAARQLIREKEDRVKSDLRNIGNYLDRGIRSPGDFESSSRTIEEKVGTNIYTHTIYSAYQPGSSFDNWICWVNDSKNSTFALTYGDSKVLASVIAAKITKGKYVRVKSMYNGYSTAQIELEPVCYIDNNDDRTFILIFDIHFLNDGRMLPSELGVPSEIASAFENYGYYYQVAVQFDKSLNIKSFCYLPYYNDGIYICSSFGGFYCIDGNLVGAIGTESSPMLRYSADCRFLNRFGTTGESIYSLCEDGRYVYLSGDTTREGYIDFANPLFYTIDNSTGKVIKYTYARKAVASEIFPSTSGLFAYMNDVDTYELVDFSLLGAYVPVVDDKLVLKTEWSDFGGYHIGGCGLVYESTGEWKVRPVYERPEDGECVICEDWKIYPFSDGLALVSYKGKYGYADETGKMVIPFRYDSASSFAGGVAAVTLGGQTYNIDKDGRKIQ